MTTIIVDKRKNSQGKSMGNRQRALSRAREALKQAASDALTRRSIESQDGQAVRVRTGALDEPSFRMQYRSGPRKIVLCGNKEFVVGDKIGKPPEQQGSGSAAGSGDGEDSTRFLLSLDEYLDLIFDGLELPRLTKRSISQTENLVVEHDGLSNTGSPAQLDIIRSMKRAKGRRIGLNRPTEEEITALEDKLDGETDEIKFKALQDQIVGLRTRLQAIPWLDPVDLKYHHYDIKPVPIVKCVIFMVMDVSGSMTPEYRMLAKRFFLLMHAFLRRQYKHVDLVFICHADEAEEVDEETFFYGHKSGGTTVSNGLREIERIQKERFPVDEYNIYVVQASDGDNQPGDNSLCKHILEKIILPFTQYMVYVEVGEHRRPSDLWDTYRNSTVPLHNLAGVILKRVEDVYPTFANIFKGQEE